MDASQDWPQSRRQWLAATLAAPLGMAQASTGGRMRWGTAAKPCG